MPSSVMMAQLDQHKKEFDCLLTELKDVFLANLNQEAIGSILHELRREINSSRVTNHITDIEGIFRILDSRNVLNQHNVEVLMTIALTAQRENAVQRIKAYSSPHASLPARPSAQVEPPESDLIDKISKLVSENIGSDWRNLARQFNFMTENEIEDIGCNENFSSDAQRSSQVLMRYRLKCRTEDEFVQRISKVLEELDRKRILKRVKGLLK